MPNPCSIISHVKRLEPPMTNAQPWKCRLWDRCCLKPTHRLSGAPHPPMIVDGLTKRQGNLTPLLQLLHDGVLRLREGNWHQEESCSSCAWSVCVGVSCTCHGHVTFERVWPCSSFGYRTTRGALVRGKPHACRGSLLPLCVKHRMIEACAECGFFLQCWMICCAPLGRVLDSKRTHSLWFVNRGAWVAKGVGIYNCMLRYWLLIYLGWALARTLFPIMLLSLLANGQIPEITRDSSIQWPDPILCLNFARSVGADMCLYVMFCVLFCRSSLEWWKTNR